jgi:Uncharacterised nucleotidyltransferase
LTALPPLPRVEHALQQATEHFAAELRQPSGRAPHWSGFEWSMARAAAVLHGVAPLLAGVLRWHGPQQWESFISQQRMHTALRQRRIDELLARIDAGAQQAGIAIMPLKGAALYRLGLYSGGERPMADVDLLVAECDAEHAKRLLLALGYLDTSMTWKHRVFEPAPSTLIPARNADAPLGEHADHPIKIDLHTRIAERLPMVAVDVSERIFPPAPHPGLNRYPSLAALFTHLLLHASGNIVLRGLRLIHLHDCALLAARMQQADWSELLAARGQRAALWWSIPALELIALYYPQVIPAAVLASLRPDCPRALRGRSRRQKISDVSFSTLRIEAFPGLAWSTSMAEKLHYMLRRAIPDRELLDKRVAITTQEAWAMHDAWSQMPHGKRILKWIVGKPPRPQPMHAVRCALEQAAEEQPADHAAHRPPAADEKRGAARMP